MRAHLLLEAKGEGACCSIDDCMRALSAIGDIGACAPRVLVNQGEQHPTPPQPPTHTHARTHARTHTHTHTHTAGAKSAKSAKEKMLPSPNAHALAGAGVSAHPPPALLASARRLRPRERSRAGSVRWRPQPRQRRRRLRPAPRQGPRASCATHAQDSTGRGGSRSTLDRGDEAEGLARPASEMSMSLGPSDWRRRTGTGGATRREGAIDWRREARLAACGFVGSAALASSHDVCSVRMSALMPRQGAETRFHLDFKGR